MNIVQITAGTGSFHCGTCLRDKALVRALRGLGHDAVMVPIYLPIVGEDVLEEPELPIFFGGISFYLRQRLPWFRALPRGLTAWLDTPRLLRLAARRTGMTAPHELGALTLAALSMADDPQRQELTRLAGWLATLQPDVICLSNVLLTGLAEPLRGLLGVPVVCTLQGEDAFLDSLPEPFSQQCWEMLRQHCRGLDALIAVSDYYRAEMQRRLQLPADRIHRVHNGIDVGELTKLTPTPATPTIGYLTQMIPGKGLETLVDAFILLHRRKTVPGLRLIAAGSLTPDRQPFIDKLRRKLADAELLADAEFRPNVTSAEKMRFFTEISVLSVPAVYGESFGLYAIEAMAAGVPVVQPRHASFPELIRETGGGVLYEPTGAEPLADALETMVQQSETMQAMGRRGRQAVIEKFTDVKMASAFLDVIGDVVTAAQRRSATPVPG